MEWQPIEEYRDEYGPVLLTGGEVDPIWYDEAAFKPRYVVGWRDVGTDELLGEWRFCSFDGGTYGEYEIPTHFALISPCGEK